MGWRKGIEKARDGMEVGGGFRVGGWGRERGIAMPKKTTRIGFSVGPIWLYD